MQGFYTVYSTVFQKLAEEERQAAAAQSDQQDRDTAANLPAFGMLLALTHVVTSSPSTVLIIQQLQQEQCNMLSLIVQFYCPGVMQGIHLVCGF